MSVADAVNKVRTSDEGPEWLFLGKRGWLLYFGLLALNLYPTYASFTSPTATAVVGWTAGLAVMGYIYALVAKFILRFLGIL